MKKLEKSMKELPKYGIKVKEYLTYAEIQNIIDQVIAPSITTWSERQVLIDSLVLYYATDLTKEDLDTDLNEMLESGLIAEVKKSVKNLYLVYQGIEHTESLTKMVRDLYNELYEPLKPLIEKAMVENGIEK